MTKNQELLFTRARAFDAHKDGPRVGDWLRQDGHYLRFTYDWGKSIQTTAKGFGLGSFYLDANGYGDYSGGLDPSIRKTELELTDEIKDGAFWFFNNDIPQAGNGLEFTLPCRVYVRR